MTELLPKEGLILVLLLMVLLLGAIGRALDGVAKKALNQSAVKPLKWEDTLTLEREEGGSHLSKATNQELSEELELLRTYLVSTVPSFVNESNDNSDYRVWRRDTAHDCTIHFSELIDELQHRLSKGT